jgi:putative polyketide hydroxylase
MSDTLKSTSLYDETTPVLIVGGGLIGLSTSLFLSWHRIPSLLVERHPSTAIHPRAVGLTPRTMELFRSVGVVEEIRKVESPFPEASNVLLVESLTGQVFDNLQDEAELGDLFTGPVPGSAIAQDVLEPVLRARAEQLGGDLRFGTELVAFEKDKEGITATIRERESGGTRTVRAQFLVAADGSHSGIRQELGIGTHGAVSLFHCISMIFEADLIELFRKRHAVMCFLSNDTIASGALVPYPGSSARPDLFRLDITYDPEEETLADYPEARCLQLIRAAVGIPDLPVQLKTVLAYEAVALVADRFEVGRVFLVGDAARTQPPSGGLGGNTGIAEAYNLAWKLAAVLHGEAGEALLATYDAERRPLADYTAEQAALLSERRQTEGSAGITVDLTSVNAGYRYSAGDPPCRKQVMSISPWPSARISGRGSREPMLRISCSNERASRSRRWTCSVPTLSCSLVHRDRTGRTLPNVQKTRSISLWTSIRSAVRQEISSMPGTRSAMRMESPLPGR